MYPPLDKDEHHAALTSKTYYIQTIFAHLLPSVYNNTNEERKRENKNRV